MRFQQQTLISRSFLLLFGFSLLNYSVSLSVSVSVCLSVCVSLSSLFYGIRLYYSQEFVIFIFSKFSNVFLICYFYSFRSFSFPTFHCQLGTFFCVKFHSSILAVYYFCRYQNIKFHSYILALYSYTLYKFLVLFLDSIHILISPIEINRFCEMVDFDKSDKMKEIYNIWFILSELNPLSVFRFILNTCIILDNSFTFFHLDISFLLVKSLMKRDILDDGCSHPNVHLTVANAQMFTVTATKSYRHHSNINIYLSFPFFLFWHSFL